MDKESGELEPCKPQANTGKLLFDYPCGLQWNGNDVCIELWPRIRFHYVKPVILVILTKLACLHLKLINALSIVVKCCLSGFINQYENGWQTF